MPNKKRVYDSKIYFRLAKKFEYDISQLKEKYKYFRKDYYEYKECVFRSAYKSNRDIREKEKEILCEKHKAYFTTFLKFCELEEKYINWKIKWGFVNYDN